MPDKNKNDYFSNHIRAVKFPFSLYHAPLARSLMQFLKEVALAKKDAEVLVIGGGLMHELLNIPKSLQLTVIDIDARVIQAVKQLHNPSIKAAQLVSTHDTPAVLKKQFDAIYAKEVIEHIIHWKEYLLAIHAALKPDGKVWLSTPNYGEPWLPLIENTFLEYIARRSGYSRKHIHPSRFSRQLLEKALLDAGFSEVHAKTAAFRLALVGIAKS